MNKEYIAVMNLTLSFPCVVSGTLYDVNTGESRPVDHHTLELAPKKGKSDVWDLHLGKGDVGDKWLLTGGVIHAGLPDKFAISWSGAGAIAPIDSGLHLNLEEVFPEDIAAILRSNDIWTLEDVVADKVTTLPLTTLNGGGMTRPLRDLLILASGGTEHVVDAWYQAAKDVVTRDNLKTSTVPAGDSKNASIG